LSQTHTPLPTLGIPPYIGGIWAKRGDNPPFDTEKFWGKICPLPTYQHTIQCPTYIMGGGICAKMSNKIFGKILQLLESANKKPPMLFRGLIIKYMEGVMLT